MKHYFILLSLSLAFIFSSCDSSKKENTVGESTTPLTIAVDESHKLLFETLEYTFEALYEKTNLNINYTTETQAVNAFNADSCSFVVISREPTEDEKKAYEAKGVYIKTTPIAEEAIAFIVNPQNPDTNITFEQITRIIAGIDTSWKNVNKKSALNGINIVFDNAGSANALYVANFNKQPQLPKNAYAVHSNTEVIEYVNKNPNAIGVIGVTWISDKDDTLTQHFLNKVKVVGINNPQNTSTFFKPYQAYIKTKEYPFTRTVYMLYRQADTGLGTAFVSFIAGDAGQRIVLKMGLVETFPTEREIKITQ